MSSQASLIAAFFGPQTPSPTPLSPPRVIHELPAPVVTFDGKTHTITIFRKDGTWLNNFFTENSLSVRARRTDDLSSLNLSPYQLEQAKKVAGDLLYYIRAQDNNVNFTEFILLESKEEADAVAKAIQEADKESCTCCGKARSFCGEDHGDQMRDWQREVLERQ
ncbi:MAG: hypothetical protein EBR81_11950 [Proteobacteria bacterium]|nr:hypothetical protein [Pseudomonadota bacterium]